MWAATWACQGLPMYLSLQMSMGRLNPLLNGNCKIWNIGGMSLLSLMWDCRIWGMYWLDNSSWWTTHLLNVPNFATLSISKLTSASRVISSTASTWTCSCCLRWLFLRVLWYFLFRGGLVHCWHGVATCIVISSPEWFLLCCLNS